MEAVTWSSMTWRAAMIDASCARERDDVVGAPLLRVPYVTRLDEVNRLDQIIKAFGRSSIRADRSAIIAGIVEAIAALLRDVQAADARTEFVPSEGDVLLRGAAGVPTGDDVVTRVMSRTATKYAYLIESGHSVDEAAKLLGVSGGRVRQMLGRHALYGFKVDGAWRLPDFQFAGSHPLPHLDEVVSRLALDVHPLAVYNWFTQPNCDLVADEGTPCSPRDWLRLGYPADPAARLAAEL